MRRLTMVAVLLIPALGACDRLNDPGIASPEVALSAAAFLPDLDGTPDLIVDQRVLAASWVIYEETFSANSCTVIEGGFPADTYRTLRFTVKTPNIGDADIYIGDPHVHVDPNGDGNTSDSDGLFEFASCHAHFHFRNYATYEILPVLANGSLGAAVQAKKRGFCMIDVDPWVSANTAPKSWVYRSCGRIGVAGNQGISTGWADTYSKWLTGQFFLLNDPQEPVPPGEYIIRITVNPGFPPQAGEPCPAVDTQGLCHMFEESDYSNNVGEARVVVPAGRVGRTGYGPGAGQRPPSVELIDSEKRPTG